MPKTIYLPRQESGGMSASGIDITWTKTEGRLDIGGWYDSFVGIETTNMTLGEFFCQLGITRKDVERALKEAR